MTETTRPRQNRDGHLCPSWCETGHDEPAGTRGLRAGWHGTDAAPVSTPSGYVTASAYQNGFNDDPPQVWIGALGMPGGWTAGPPDAERLAVLAEQLADATPDQHREFAAQLRRAAAQVTEVTEAGHG